MVDEKLQTLDKDDKDLSEVDFLDLNEVLEGYDEDKEESLSSGESGWDPSLRDLVVKDPESIVQGKKLYCARTYEEYESFIRRYYKKGKVAYDIETNAQSPLFNKADIIGFSNAFSKDEGIYVLRDSLEYNMPEDDWNKIIRLLLNVFNGVDQAVVHNCKYEVPYTVNQFKYYLDDDKIQDTMIKCRVCYPGEPAGLKPAAAKYLGYGDWDSVLGLYTKSAKSIINYIYWVYNTSRKKNYTDTDVMIYNLIFDDVSRIRDPQLLYEKLFQISETYDGTGKSLIIDMMAILQVLVQADSMQSDVLDALVSKFVDIGKVGLDTNVIPYSLIPSKVISKYGAMDSISTYELDDFMNESMVTRSKDINDRVLKITGEDLHFDLNIGYHNVKKQFFAGINLEMAGAKWNDDVANEQYDWYNKTAIESWKRLVTSPKMKEKFLYSNRYKFSDKLYNCLINIYNGDDDSEFSLEVKKWLDSKGQYKLQKSQITFYDIVDENVWSKKENRYVVGPLKVRLKKVFEHFEDELYSLFKHRIDEQIMNVVNSDVECYKDLKKYYNPSSTDKDHYEMVDEILNDDDLKLAFVYDWALLQLSTDKYWETEDGNPQPGLEGSFALFNFLQMIKDNDVDIPQPVIFEKFKELLSNVNINNDLKIKEQLETALKFKIESLKEPQMITLYNMYKHLGIDVEDESTWNEGFTWLYNFRMYKKCVKMITSYIEGRVGRSSVTIVDKSDDSKLLPRRKRWYYDNYDSENPSKEMFDKETEDTIMTMPWHVCTADTGKPFAVIR